MSFAIALPMWVTHQYHPEACASSPHYQHWFSYLLLIVLPTFKSKLLTYITESKGSSTNCCGIWLLIGSQRQKQRYSCIPTSHGSTTRPFCLLSKSYPVLTCQNATPCTCPSSIYHSLAPFPSLFRSYCTLDKHIYCPLHHQFVCHPQIYCPCWGPRDWPTVSRTFFGKFKC